METENAPAVILSVIAILISAVAIGVVCFSEPETVDLSEAFTRISGNTDLISALKTKVNDIEIPGNIDWKGLRYLDFGIIDDGDLEDLEKYASDFDEIEDKEEAIKTLKGRVTDLEDAPTPSDGDVEVCYDSSETWVEFATCLYPEDFEGN